MLCTWLLICKITFILFTVSEASVVDEYEVECGKQMLVFQIENVFLLIHSVVVLNLFHGFRKRNKPPRS